ncbi:flagellar brake protein [Niveibacterium terrae]|uniref:flagellar brake protein n=1 Tax=Niveibacterium terrae TaxID=3373598 RepID=UPI003A94EF3E
MNSLSNIRFELLEADHYSQFLVHNGREIRQLLRQLASQKALISIYPNRSGDFGLSSLIEVSDSADTFVLDAVGDSDLSARLLGAKSCICITQLDNVKIQFEVKALTLTEFKGGLAYSAEIPETLLRLQRREYFRLIAPVAHALRCLIPQALPEGKTRWVEARVVDISGGGLSIVAPPAELSMDIDAEFPDCRIELPDSAPISTTLRVRNLFRVTQRNGVEVVRAGCQFIGLTGSIENTINRYILRVERERAALGRE